MSIFISWSGDRAKSIAEGFQNLVRFVLPGTDSFLSTKIPSGRLWFQKVQTALEVSQFGVLIATQESVKSPWVMFEAGAIWKARTESAVAAILVDITEQQLPKPLGDFQAVHANYDQTKKLLNDIRAATQHKIEADVFEELFAAYWPKFEARLKVAVEADQAPEAETDDPSTSDLLFELLERVDSIVDYLADQRPVSRELEAQLDRLEQIIRPVKPTLASMLEVPVERPRGLGRGLAALLDHVDNSTDAVVSEKSDRKE